MKDITELVKKTCAGIDSDKIIAMKDFDLLKVMTAIEIMDPKMDCYAVNSERVLSANERYEKGLLPVGNDVDVDGLLCVIDGLIRAEQTWYEGVTLPQSIYTCLYMQLDPLDLIKNSFLKVYIKSTIWLVKDIVSLMRQTEVLEEEEFTPYPFHFDLYSENLDKIVDELKSMETIISQHLSKTKVDEYLSQEKNSSKIQALLTRFKFRRMYIESHESVLTRIESNVINAANTLKQATKEFNLLLKQHHDLEISDNSSVFFDKRMPCRVPCVHPLVPVDLMSFKKASENLVQFLSDVDYVFGSVKNNFSLDSLVEYFQVFHKKEANVLCRARLIHLFYNHDKVFGKKTIHELVIQRLSSLPNLSETHKDMLEHPQNYPNCEQWLHNIGLCHLLLIHALCLNKARFRRKLKSLCPEFAACEQKAEHLDMLSFEKHRKDPKEPLDHRNMIFSYYMLDVTLNLMQMYLSLGFELDIFDYEEYCPMMWYLDYLTVMRSRNYALLDDRELLKNAKFVKKQKKLRKVNELRQSEAAHRSHMIKLMMFVRRGYVTAFVGLMKAGFFNQIESEARFIERNSPFVKLPSIVTVGYSQYKTFVDDPDVSVAEWIDIAIRHFMEAHMRCVKMETDPAISGMDLSEITLIKDLLQRNQVSLNVCKHLIETKKSLKDHSKRLRMELYKNRYVLIKLENI